MCRQDAAWWPIWQVLVSSLIARMQFAGSVSGRPKAFHITA